MLLGSTPPIDLGAHPHGLATLEPLTVNGTRQWVLIRTEDVANPLLLFLHGGPGTSQLALSRAHTGPLERHFTVVNWDQRGAGKSFAAGADRSALTLPQFVDDVLALSAQLALRFRQPRLVLAGHSWGSLLGMLAVAKRPELFRAYVGIGQTSRGLESEHLSYEWTIEQARSAGDHRIARRLRRLGPPPYARRRDFTTQRQLLGRYGGELWGSRHGAFGLVLRHLRGPEYTLVDRLNFFRGIFRSLDALLPELYRFDLFRQVPEVKVPVWFCLGRHDWEVPSVLAARYFDALAAPRKSLVWFERSAHLPSSEEPERFNAVLIDSVLPALA